MHGSRSDANVREARDTSVGSMRAVSHAYAAAMASDRVATIRHWVDGKPWDGASTRIAPVTNPATGAVTGHVPLASAADVDTVVQRARVAFETWRHAPLNQRARVLFAFREVLEARAAE